MEETKKGGRSRKKTGKAEKLQRSTIENCVCVCGKNETKAFAENWDLLGWLAIMKLLLAENVI